MSKRKKMLWVTRVIPLEATGSPTVLRKLLLNLDSEEVVLLGRKPKKRLWLEGELHYPNYMAFSPEVKGRKILANIHGWVLGQRIIKKHKPDGIIAVYPDDASLFLGYMLHRKTGLPLHVYFIDLYQENKKGVWKIIADWLQPKVLKAATRVFAVNEGMKKYHLKKYNIKSVLLPTAINQAIPSSLSVPILEKDQKLIVAYSGSLSRDRIQPFREMATVLNRYPDKFEFRFFSGQSIDDLKKAGCYVEGMKHKFCKDAEELLDELKQCHLFYLPLTFSVGQDSREQLATAFGIKAYEYMLAGRPILIHCPADYFTSSFFSERNAAYCLNELSESAVETMLVEVCRNYNKDVPQIINNALKAAESFKGDKIVAKFRRTI